MNTKINLIKAEEPNINLFHEMGDCFLHVGADTVYMLSLIETNKMVAIVISYPGNISYSIGNRNTDPISVTDPYKITEIELEKMLGSVYSYCKKISKLNMEYVL